MRHHEWGGPSVWTGERQTRAKLPPTCHNAPHKAGRALCHACGHVRTSYGSEVVRALYVVGGTDIGVTWPPGDPRLLLCLFSAPPNVTTSCRSTIDARSPQFPPVFVHSCTVVVSPDELAYWRAVSGRLGDPDWGGWANRTLAGAFQPMVRWELG